MQYAILGAAVDPERPVGVAVQRIAGWIVSARWALLALALLPLLPALKVLPELRTNNNVDAFLAEGDPGLAFYRETTDRFGGDHVVYVAMEAGDGGIWTRTALQRLQVLTEAASGVDGVHEVLSLAAQGAPADEAGIAALRERVRRSPLLGQLVAPGDEATLLAIELDADLIHDPTGETAAVVALRQALTSAGGERPRMAGNPVLAETIEANNVRDTNLFSGLMMLLVGLSTLVLLRRIGPALLPGLVVLVAVGWTIGWFVAAGNQTNWVTSIIAPILMLVGVADAVHFLARYQQELPNAGSRKEAVRRTLEAITLPCLFTSLTTAAGFTSLVVNEVVPVRTFGIYAGLGVLLALVATLAVLPAVLAAGTSKKAPPKVEEGRFTALLASVDRRVRARPVVVVLVSLAVLLPLTAGAFFIQVETNLLKYFADDAPLVQDSLFIEEAWGGCSPLDIVVDAGKAGAAIEPATLEAVAELHGRLEALPGVARGVSVVDLVADLSLGTGGEGGIPVDHRVVDLLLLSVDDDVLGRWLEPDRRLLRMSTRFQGATLGVQEARAVIEDIEEAAAEALGGRASARLTGSSLLFMNMDDYLVQGQIKSVALLLLVLLVAMTVLFRSVRMGLLAMVPNVVPIAVMLGLMGWLDIRLDGFTVMIACIAVGIGVDDTIHYLHHLKHELGAGKPLERAMADTVTSVGRALVFTSVVLALGFWIFCLSDFVGTFNFGLLTGVTVLVALVADLVMLPAAIKLVGVPKSWLKPAR